MLISNLFFFSYLRSIHLCALFVHKIFNPILIWQQNKQLLKCSYLSLSMKTFELNRQKDNFAINWVIYVMLSLYMHTILYEQQRHVVELRTVRRRLQLIGGGYFLFSENSYRRFSSPPQSTTKLLWITEQTIL